MFRKLSCTVLTLAVSLVGVAPAYGDDVIWDFENGNDHGFTLWSVRYATPAPDDPSIAGDEALTGVGGPDGLPEAGIAWTVGPPDQFDGQKPAFSEGDKAKADGTMEYNQPGKNHPFGFPVNDRGQESYLNTYNLTEWGDNVHTNTNDQIATSPLVLLGDNAVLTVWTAGANNNYHAPELDPNPAEGYTTNSCGIAIISEVDGSLLASVFTPSTGGNVNEYTIDLTAFAGQRVYVEVVDAYEGSWGWIAVDEIRITNAKALIAPPTNAYNPSPANGATDVPREVVLSWTPGDFAPAVNGHTVYLSENFSDVNDGIIGGIAQDASSYAPAQRLDFGTTYYWRVDEVNGPPDYTVFEGDVWSFTTEPVGYPIENVTATASSTQNADTGPENTVNGSGLDYNDLHSTEATDMWLSGSEPNGAWIEYELDKVHKLHEMWVWNSNQTVEPLVGSGIKDVKIEYSVNGTDYATLGTTHQFAQAPGTPGYAYNTTVDFGGVGAKYVRLTASSNWGGLVNQYGLSEVRFFHIPVHATEPYPDSGATYVDLDVVLGWNQGREAAKHDVYLSTDEQAVIDGTAPVTTVTETSYAPLSLDLGKTYYWRVDEVNEAETLATWQGELWDFTTPGYFVVDDFESYNDLDPSDPKSNRIFMIWKDGVGYGAQDNPPYSAGNGTGSIIGHAVPPFVELEIVHGGSQSMPYFYNNSGSTGKANYSEVEADISDLEIGSDWTKGGVEVLPLYFYGDPDNNASATDRIYVALKDSLGHLASVPYAGGPSEMKEAWWHEWVIELKEFSNAGVDLTNITNIYLGVGNRVAPQLGASGVLFFDDIRLLPSRSLLPEPEPITQTPVAHWALDEGAGTIVVDSAGGHTGTVKGGVGTIWVAGKIGAHALHFNGEDNHYVDCGTFNPTTAGTNELTCAVWAKWDGSTRNWQGLVCKRDTWAEDGMMWQMEINRGTDLLGVFKRGGGRLYTLEPLVREWQHVAFTVDNANNSVLYIDGQAVAAETTFQLGTGTSAHVLIGGTFYQNAVGQDCFNGALDDVYLFNDALTQGQIIKLMGF